MKTTFHNKVVVITGATKGIGRELAKAFALEGATIVLNYSKHSEDAEDSYSEIKKISQNSVLIQADVSKEKDVSYMYQCIMNSFGHVDILVNNAGICDDNLMQMMPMEQWQRVIDVNLTGVFLCTREFSKPMIKQRKGKIINISSLKGQEGCRGQANYSASKAGVISLTKTASKELGEFNVSVNAICPGFIVTDLNRHNQEKKEIAIKRSLLSIESSMQDLVQFCLFLSSDLIKGVSGQVFNVDSRI